jgi:L-fuconolactonase
MGEAKLTPPIVDAHQHFWDIDRFDYWWLTPERDVLRRNYLPEDLIPLLSQSSVNRTVAVQAHNSLMEANWLLELASANDFLAGVVGWVDLTSRDVARDLDLLQQHPKFKGVRHSIEAEPDDAWMLRKDAGQGFGELERRGIPFDLIIWPRHLKYLPQLREKCPRLRLVIDHVALPPIAEKKMESWARDMETVARLPEVWCKLSGMITRADPKTWKPEDLRPYVDHVVRYFGHDRLIFGTDWPICTLAGSYMDVIEALRKVLGPLQEEDAAKIWGGNAKIFYRLD